MKWLFLLLMLSHNLYAGTTIRAHVQGKSLHWDNVITLSSEQMVPSFWQHSVNLTATSSWLPGGLVEAGTNTIELTNGTDIISLPIQFLGFEYNLGSSAASKGSDWLGDVCKHTRFTGSTIFLADGIQCFFQHKLVTPHAVTPYTFIRPVFNLDKNQVIGAFANKSAGVYSGQTRLHSQYLYDHNGIESRRYIDHIIAFELKHTPSTLTQVSVIGNSELQTSYDMRLKQVSGNTYFKITANGYFTQGLTVSLVNHRTDYLMQGPNLTTLPYSIDCIGCATQSLVHEGKVETLQTHVSGKEVSIINFDIKLFFENQDLTLLEQGQYSDTLTLIVEPAL